MSNIENKLRSRNGDISDVGNITDGNDIIGRNAVKASLMKVPPKESMNKTSKVKKKSRSKFYDERSEQFKCPECGQLFDTGDDVSKHVWYYHKYKAEKVAEKREPKEIAPIQEKHPKKRRKSKYYDEVLKQYKCPTCGKICKDSHDAGSHFSKEHRGNDIKIKTRVIENLAPVSNEDENKIDLLESLKTLPLEIIDALDSKKLKQLIINYNYKLKQKGRGKKDG